MLRENKIQNRASSGETPLSLSEVLSLAIRFGNKMYRTPFAIADIADILSVCVLFRTRFFSEHLKSIDVEHRRFIFKRHAKVPNSPAMTEREDSPERLARASRFALTRKQSPDLETDGSDASPIFMTRVMVIPAMAQIVFPLQTNARKIVYIKPKPLLQFRHGLQVFTESMTSRQNIPSTY